MIPSPNETDVIILIATAGIAIESIALGLLGVLYAVYSQVAEPDQEGRRWISLLDPLRVIARIVIGFVVLNALTIILATSWLLKTNEILFVLITILFFAQIGIVPVLAIYIWVRLFR